MHCRNGYCKEPFPTPAGPAAKASPAPPAGKGGGKGKTGKKGGVSIDSTFGQSVGTRVGTNFSDIYNGLIVVVEEEEVAQEPMDVSEEAQTLGDPHPARTKAMELKKLREQQLQEAKDKKYPESVLKVLQQEVDAVVVPSLAAHMQDATRTLTDLLTLQTKTVEDFVADERASSKRLEAASKQLEEATNRLQKVKDECQQQEVARERTLASMQAHVERLRKEVAGQEVKAEDTATPEQVQEQQAQYLGKEAAAKAEEVETAAEYSVRREAEMMEYIKYMAKEQRGKLQECLAEAGFKEEVETDAKRRKSAEAAEDQELADVS